MINIVMFEEIANWCHRIADIKDVTRKEIILVTITLFLFIATSAKTICPSLTDNDTSLISRFYGLATASLVFYFIYIQLKLIKRDYLWVKLYYDIFLFVNLFLTACLLLALVFSFSGLGYLIHLTALLSVLLGLYPLGVLTSTFIWLIGKFTVLLLWLIKKFAAPLYSYILCIIHSSRGKL